MKLKIKYIWWNDSVNYGCVIISYGTNDSFSCRKTALSENTDNTIVYITHSTDVIEVYIQYFFVHAACEILIADVFTYYYIYYSQIV